MTTDPNSQGSIRSHPAPHDEEIPGAGKMGMLWFLASLSMLFAASLIGYVVVRVRQEAWPPPGMPSLPSGLWLSTLVILGSSFTIQKALDCIRHESQKGLRTFLTATCFLGGVFLLLQTMNWYGLVTAHLGITANLYAFTFYMLTGLHALHVVGGLLELGWVTGKAYRGCYSANYYPGVLYSAMYWHFLDGVWLILFTVLVLVG